jgi:hypothetical protein
MSEVRSYPRRLEPSEVQKTPLLIVPPCMGSFSPCDVQDNIDGLKRSHLKVIIPRQVTGLRYRAAPRDQNNMVALRDGVLDERIPRTKLKQIAFVDARDRVRRHAFDELGAHRAVAKNSHRRADDLTRGT